VTIKGGISTNVTGLTPNQNYYVQSDGSLASGNIPYSISGASYDSVNFSVTSQDSSPKGISFNANGTKMFVVGQTNDSVYEYALTTAYDVSTASHSQSFSVASQDANPRGIAFNTAGTKMFVVGYAESRVNEYALATGFDVSTASFSQFFSVASQDSTPQGIAFNTDGTKMFVVGNTGDSVYEYSLTTGFNLLTLTALECLFPVLLQMKFLNTL
jgi:glutamine cyclotransferase